MGSGDIVAMKLPALDQDATGRIIRRLRRRAEIRVRELQLAMGFTNPQAIYKWEKGMCLPSIDNLIALAAILGVFIDGIRAGWYDGTDRKLFR